MKPDEPSRTALMIGRQRAAHQVLDHGSILHDPFAIKILHEEEKDVLQFAKQHPLASIGRLFTTARSRIAEDVLSRAVGRGTRQIVILGAGLDTFARRNPHSALPILIYEVDHPATQAWKRQRLADAEFAMPPWLVLVPVDFEQDDVGERLVAAGFKQNSPAFFTWLGVIPYGIPAFKDKGVLVWYAAFSDHAACFLLLRLSKHFETNLKVSPHPKGPSTYGPMTEHRPHTDYDTFMTLAVSCRPAPRSENQ